MDHQGFCGVTAVAGAILPGWNVIELFFLLTGRTGPGLDRPPIAAVAVLLVTGLVLLVAGYGVPKRLDTDRLP